MYNFEHVGKDDTHEEERLLAEKKKLDDHEQKIDAKKKLHQDHVKQIKDKKKAHKEKKKAHKRKIKEDKKDKKVRANSLQVVLPDVFAPCCSIFRPVFFLCL